MYERILPRLGAATGALFVILLFGPSSSGSDATIILVLELLGLLLFIPFLGYLWSVLREAEGPGGWLATTAFGAGLVDVTLKLGSLPPGKVADDFGESTAIHKALEDMNSVAFIRCCRSASSWPPLSSSSRRTSCRSGSAGSPHSLPRSCS
jgi:hypothetical protein